MSKPYFAKYLPVEGEIKKGDKFKRGEDDICTFLKWLQPLEDGRKKSLVQNSWAGDKGIHAYFGQDIKPVKLFLCSKDIRVGDEVWSPDSNRNMELDKFTLTAKAGDKSEASFAEGTNPKYNNGNPIYLSYLTFKVIGEISTEAIWVTEGMEFDEDEVEIWWYNILKDKFTPHKYEPSDEYTDLVDNPALEKRPRIKCPTCKMFH